MLQTQMPASDANGGDLLPRAPEIAIDHDVPRRKVASDAVRSVSVSLAPQVLTSMAGLVKGIPQPGPGHAGENMEIGIYSFAAAITQNSRAVSASDRLRNLIE